MDEQNAQTSASTSSLAEAFVTVAVTAAGQVVTTSTARTERGLEPIQGKAIFSYQELLRLAADHLRTVRTIVIAHTFCASPDTRISYCQCLLIQGSFCSV